MSKFYDVEGIFYCKECNLLYKSCYEYEGISMCRSCWSDVEFIPEMKIKAFIRKKRLKRLKEVFSNQENSLNL